MEYEEHEKRAWSVDFSYTEPSMLVSGSDDCKVLPNFGKHFFCQLDGLCLCRRVNYLSGNNKGLGDLGNIKE